jgi:ER membrane protein complex subunit 4
MDTLKLKKAWEVAIAPAKQLPMNAIMMYMSGNSLQIFSIMMVWMLFKNPITAIMNINPTFTRFETESTKANMMLVKVAYIGTNLLALALGIWKVNGMGLLP